ncbi:TIGR02206 family membrane protein [Weissella cibaria]|uniref:YwaF family protein n=1 Tax=Weissella cibaria TaxID=137591 RepID=UPI00106DE2A2|nr:TIGR02206 family membrane protein [Weissella cibaria]MBZ5941971.1 TIGR02206 family membrane protein [Weissella cibaria]MCB5826114.1 TIGR02206 family membrane protein [Weissella cibaria]MCB5857673.1 TIGR02206 family membrane protein [Weissella cibaria]MCB5859899.1 TIGR02206 family membrane protein [Weissella cibaria]MCB5862191.1 TIGR02206 family membrane protein [Weissella cibaria]
MFNYYLTYQPDIPVGIGFGQFSGTHLTVLGVLAIGIYYLVHRYQRLTLAGRRHQRWGIALAIWTMELFKDIYLATTGQWDPNLLPFHLCGFGLMMVAIDAIRPNKTTQTILYSLTIWGAVAAEIFPDWAYYPLLNQWALQSFVIHALLITYPLMLMVSGEMVPNWRDLWRSVVFLCGAVPFVLWVNARLQTNFFFLNTAAPGSPLEPLQHMFGHGALYISVIIMLLGVLWVVMYLPWALAPRRKTILA